MREKRNVEGEGGAVIGSIYICGVVPRLVCCGCVCVFFFFFYHLNDRYDGCF